MTVACSEALGIVDVARDFGDVTRPVAHADASAAIGVAQRKGFGSVRHMDTHTLWTQEEILAKSVKVLEVNGERNPAD